VTVAEKLQIRPGTAVALLNAPDRVRIVLPEGCSETDDPATADAVLLFTTGSDDLAARAAPFVEAARRDALAWVAYPKAGQLGTDLNRDSLWELLSGRAIRPVRQVSIDDVWSALRFRPA
jgi:hypothetical protein